MPQKPKFPDVPTPHPRYTRRGWLETAGRAAAGAVILPLGYPFLSPVSPAKKEVQTYLFRGDPELLGKGRFWLRPDRRPKALSREKIDLLNEVVDRIVPEDDQPGAKSVGVVHFIDRQLADSQPEERNRFLHGVERIDPTSRAVFRRIFSALDPEEQTGLLKRLESGEVPTSVWEGYNSTEFFTQLKVMTLKGYYSCHQVWEHLHYPGPSMWLGYPEVLSGAYEI